MKSKAKETLSCLPSKKIINLTNALDFDLSDWILLQMSFTVKYSKDAAATRVKCQ